MALFWSLVFVDPLIILSTFICGVISLIASPFDPTGEFMMKTARFWARSLLVIAGVKVKVEGLEKLVPGSSYVFFKIPLLGTHLGQAGHIPVPREDPRAAVKTMTLAADIIRSRNISILIFPEGGRAHDGVLQPFKDGASYIAIKAGVPIVPLAISGTREILAMHSATFHRGEVILRIGDPIPTKGLTLHHRKSVSETARECVVAMLHQ
jgi:1-acyl-sn-glycerol-3-phosphate acyltransferase